MARNPYLMNIGSRESGGDYGARSKTSSAGGKYQFLDSTWLGVIKKVRPDLRGATDRELLKLKTDTSEEGRAIQEQAANYYLQNEVVPSLARQGIEPTKGNVYLAWFAGPEGARDVLQAAPDTPINKILSGAAMKANSSVKLGKKPFSEFTQSDLVTWAEGRGSPQASVEGQPQQEQTTESTADVLEETVPATMGRSAPDRSGRDIQNLARYYEGMSQSRAAPLLGIPNLMAARQQEESSQDGIASLFPYSDMPSYARGGEVTKADVDALYQDYFGRGGDEDGLKYWEKTAQQNNLTLDDIGREFSSTKEYQDLQNQVAGPGASRNLYAPTSDPSEWKTYYGYKPNEKDYTMLLRAGLGEYGKDDYNQYRGLFEALGNRAAVGHKGAKSLADTITPSQVEGAFGKGEARALELLRSTDPAIMERVATARRALDDFLTQGQNRQLTTQTDWRGFNKQNQPSPGVTRYGNPFLNRFVPGSDQLSFYNTFYDAEENPNQTARLAKLQAEKNAIWTAPVPPGRETDEDLIARNDPVYTDDDGRRYTESDGARRYIDEKNPLDTGKTEGNLLTSNVTQNAGGQNINDTTKNLYEFGSYNEGGFGYNPYTDDTSFNPNVTAGANTGLGFSTYDPNSFQVYRDASIDQNAIQQNQLANTASNWQQDFNNVVGGQFNMSNPGLVGGYNSSNIGGFDYSGLNESLGNVGATSGFGFNTDYNYGGGFGFAEGGDVDFEKLFEGDSRAMQERTKELAREAYSKGYSSLSKEKAQEWEGLARKYNLPLSVGPFSNYEDQYSDAVSKWQRGLSPKQRDRTYSEGGEVEPKEDVRSLKKTVKEAARLGEGRDKIMAHLSPGEIVLPLNFQKKFPAVEAALRQSFAKAGIDYEQYVAGSAQNRINPRTGAPMFDEGNDGGGGPSDSGTSDSGTNDGNYGGDPDGIEASNYGNDFNNDFSNFFGGAPNSENNENSNTSNEGGPQSGDPGGGFLGDLGGFLGGLLGGRGDADPESNLDEYGRDVRDIYGNEYIGDITGVTGSPSNPGSGRAAVDPTVDPNAPTKDAKDVSAVVGLNSPGQLAFDSMMNTAVGLFTQGYLTSDLKAEDIVSNPYNTPFDAPPETREALAREDADRAAVEAYLSGPISAYGVDPYETVDTAPNLSTADPAVNTAVSEAPSYLTDEDVDALDRQASELDTVNAVSDPFGSLNQAAFNNPALGNTSLGTVQGFMPTDYSNPNFMPGLQARVDADRAQIENEINSQIQDPGKFTNRAGNLQLAPAVAPVVTTEERAEPREVTIKGVKGNVPSSVTSATPGYDISTYGIDPYETISGAVQQGATTTDRDGTPDGGGENVRRRLTEEEIQYLAEMGYLPGEAVPVASSDTVRPSVAPITYDISKFLSRSNR